MTKYGNKKTTVNGLPFDSKAEAGRYLVLSCLEKAGKIMDLRRQVAYVLAPGVKLAGEKRARPAMRYLADFVYARDGVLVVEDVKSPATAKLSTFRAKQHLMKHIHGLDVTVFTK